MELSVIAPTFNEALNVEPFVRRTSEALRGIQHEIVIVDDDSPDETWRVAQGLDNKLYSVRVLRRKARPSLSGSVIDGFEAASGNVIACMDADLQHDPKILPQMLAEIRRGAELVVGCRYMPGGGTSNWHWIRRLQSWTATRLARAYLGLTLRDPMSGYFMLRRQDFLAIRNLLSAQGFKILIEIAARLRAEHVAEVPFVFGPRVAGVSKLNAAVAISYLMQLHRLRATAIDTRVRAATS